MPLVNAIATIVLSSSTQMSRLPVWAGIGAIAGMSLFVRGFQMLRYKRLILNTPASKVRSASMGLVELSGQAKGPHTIPAGITGDDCYYYHATAWRLKQSGRSQSWECVANESLYLPFFVEDSTGRMLINAQGAQLDVHCNFKDEFRSSFFTKNETIAPSVSRFLIRYGLVGEDGIRIEEYCIKPDYPLFVLGTLGRTSDGQDQQWSPESHVPQMQVSHASNFSFVGPAAGTFLRSLGWIPGITVGATSIAIPPGFLGKPAAPGVARPAAPPSAAWSSVSMDSEILARGSDLAAILQPVAPQESAASSVAVAEAAPIRQPIRSAPAVDNTGFEIHPVVAIGKGADGAPFTISSRSQREVVQSLAWRSTLCIWGGPALTLGCLYFLCFALGWL